MLSKDIKELIYVQLEDIYAESKPKLTEKEIKERIDIFAMALSLSNECEVKALKVVENDITQVFEDIQRAKAQVDEKNINLCEPYFRLLCYLLDEKRFNQRRFDVALLGKLYRELDVLQTNANSKRKNYYDILFDRDEVPYEYGDPRHAEKVLKSDIEILPFIKAYCGRNAIIHKQLLPDEWEHFMCMFYTLIEVTYKSKEVILPKFINKEIENKKYINKIISDYEEKLGENFTYIPLSIDIFQNDSSYKLEQIYSLTEDVTFEEINEDLNLGTIQLEKNFMFNKAKIIGYAGMGKTTTIENIIYKEAVQVKKNHYQGKIPILIELIKVSNVEDTIEKLIAKKLGTENLMVVSQLIKRNMIKLYLDGINEIIIPDFQEKRKYLERLEEFIIKNKQLKIVITDRDNNENSILNNYPTFILTGVTEENIEKFILGNSSKPEIVNEKIKQAIEKRPSLVNALKNPFMLKNMIAIVECNRPIPEIEDDIAEEFLKAIVERERVVKRDYKAPHILRLLIYVVAKDLEMNEGLIENNMVISYFKLMELFDEYCNKYKRTDRFNYDDMLELIVKLGIMKKIDTEKYTFVDDKYYNFFYYSADDLGLL